MCFNDQPAVFLTIQPLVHESGVHAEKHGVERKTRIERSENTPVLYYFVYLMFALFCVFVHHRRSNPALFRD